MKMVGVLYDKTGQVVARVRMREARDYVLLRPDWSSVESFDNSFLRSCGIEPDPRPAPEEDPRAFELFHVNSDGILCYRETSLDRMPLLLTLASRSPMPN